MRHSCVKQAQLKSNKQEVGFIKIVRFLHTVELACIKTKYRLHRLGVWWNNENYSDSDNFLTTDRLMRGDRLIRSHLKQVRLYAYGECSAPPPLIEPPPY